MKKTKALAWRIQVTNATVIDMKTFSPLINIEELLVLSKKNKILLMDARVGADVKNTYLEQHLEGALHVDLNTDLANIKSDAANGGRHPLPKLDEFSMLLGNLGIKKTTHIVVYDDKNASNAAARFWWMLKAIGHKKIQVLNGGFQAAITNGFPTNNGKEILKKTTAYPAKNWQPHIVDLEDVEKAVQNPLFTVIDVRDAARYRGEKEPIDLIAGHIPGAINVPFTENLDEKGFFLPKEILKLKYEKVIENQKVIVHCGSGVTACHTILAMVYAGFEMPKLYVGSWSEWSRNGKEIATNL